MTADTMQALADVLTAGATEIEEMSPVEGYVWTNMKDVEGNEFCVSQGLSPRKIEGLAPPKCRSRVEAF